MLAAMAIAYSVYRADRVEYWDGAVGNWLATLLGIIVGIPVALSLERNRERAENEAKARVERQMRLDVLALLKRELAEAERSIVHRMSLGSSVPVEPLKVSSWEAMKATGNLKYVSEPSLIEPISDAYRLIQVLAQEEFVLHRTVFGVNVQFPDGENAAVKIMRNLTAFQAPSVALIRTALSAIEAALAATK